MCLRVILSFKQKLKKDWIFIIILIVIVLIKLRSREIDWVWREYSYGDLWGKIALKCEKYNLMRINCMCLRK